MTTHQGVVLRAKTAPVILVLLASWPMATARLHFLQIVTPLAVAAEKSHPPHIAFVEAERQHVPDEWDIAFSKPSQPLNNPPPPPIAQIQLPPMVISYPHTADPVQLADADFASLSAADEQQETIKDAGHPYEPMPISVSARESIQDSQDDQESVSLPRTLTSMRVSSTPDNPAAGYEHPETDTAQNSDIPSAMANYPPLHSPDPKIAKLTRLIATSPLPGKVHVAGNVSLNGGESLGPGRMIEVSQVSEGVEVAQGNVDVKHGTYSIDIDGAKAGDVIARMRDSQGQILGEATYHLAQMQATGPKVAGPSLDIMPRKDISGRVIPLYEGAHAGNFRVSAFSGSAPISVAKNGDFELNQIQKGSYTVVHSQAKNYATSVAMVAAGSRADLTVFPTSWVNSLKKIISDQRRMSLDDPDSAIVWGRVTQDGKARAGLTVELESEPEIEAVYFNQFMLPDPNLKSTSTNGMFALIGAHEGFQSLLAKAGDGYYAHQNIVVENGSISVAELSSTLKSVAAPVRVFDAFTGAPESAEISHQSAGDLTVDESGSTVMMVTMVHRTSLTVVRPESPYAPATYLNNDDDGYLHIPLVRDDWIRAMESYEKIDDIPESATVVGFVSDDDFTVDAVDPAGKAKVLFFDSEGKPVDGGVGPRGGGFIIVGLSPGVREILVTMESTKQIASRVIPADPKALEVLAFHGE